MKKHILFFLLLAMVTAANAAYLRNVRVTLSQPDGTKFECFASGDEFYNYLHDAQGFTIILNPSTGYYVYADLSDDKLIPTQLIAGRSNPAESLTPYLNISAEKRMQMRKAWDVPEHLKVEQKRTRETNHGTINNIVIFIRFADDGNFQNSFQSVNNMFNINTSSQSMQGYFAEASYNQLNIQTTFYPAPNGNQIVSYQDSHNRGYYQEYSYSNPEGYQGGNDGYERMQREQALLKNAVNYVNSNNMVPGSLNIDYDNDGYVDNVCFIVRGEPGAWSSLLWPHQWSLYNEYAYINGKRVYTFNFQLADAGEGYFDTSTMCHEMNHSLGAPDLYHYYYGTNLNPVGLWDLMEYNANPPQHMGAYMKYRYGNWIDNIPEITSNGTYSLHDLSSSTNNCYKIASTSPGQYYILEYRKKSVEAAIPGSGLLIYRINTAADGMGNMEYDGYSNFDEVYIYRPNGTTTQNGNYNNAHFSSQVGRTAFDATTNPHAFLINGSLDNDIHISSISSAGETISFTVTLGEQQQQLQVTATEINDSNVNVAWTASESVTFNFDNSSLQGWTTIDADGDGHNWMVGSEMMGTGNGHNGSNDLVLSQSYENDRGILYPDNYLICPTKDHYTQMSFWACGQDANYAAEHFSVEVSTTNNTNASAFTTIQEWTLTAKDQGTWHQFTVDLSQYSGQQIWVAIRHFNCHDQFYIDVDDITLLKTSGKVSKDTYTVYRKNVATGSQTTLSSNVNGMSYNDSGWGSVSAGQYKWGVKTNGTSDIFWSNAITKQEIIETYNVTVTATPTAGGTVSGGGTYDEGTSATVTATPNAGYHFVNWKEGSNVVSTSASYTFTVTSNRNLVAYFELSPVPTYNVTVTANPTAGGTVSGGGTYDEGTSVTVTAAPNAGYHFVNWKEGSNVVSTNSSYTFTVTSNRNLVAYFELSPVPTYNVTVTANPTAGGIVSGGGTYDEGTTATVTATPNAGYHFVNWKEGSNVVSTNSSYTFTVTSNRNLVAYFELSPVPTYNVTVTANPTAGGTVSGGGTYDEGETVTVTAVANANYIFVNWTENGTELSTSTVYSFEVTRDMNVTANFSYITGVEENSVAVEVYPNPANAEMNIICERMKRITIISISGKVVFDAEVANDKETVDVSRFSQGSYILRISTIDDVVTKIVTVTK